MAGALIFSRPPSGAALVFGAQDGTASGAIITVNADFEALQGRVLVAPPMRAVASGVFDDSTGVVVTAYDINVDRPLASGARTHWQNAETMQAPVSAAWQDAARMVSGPDARWSEAQPVESQIDTGWQDVDHLQQILSTRYQDAQRLPLHPLITAWQDAHRLRRGVETGWQDGESRRSGIVSDWQDADRTARLWLDAHWQDATPMRAGYVASAGAGAALSSAWFVRWQDGIVPPPGRQDRPGVEEPVKPREPDASLVFYKPANTGSAALVFDWSPDVATHVIPIRRTYIVFNEVSLRRTDSSTEVQALSLDISIDADSWLPSWSAEVAFSEWPSLAAENGQPLELEAIVNGHRWLLLAEGAPVRSRTFGKTSVRLRGRGIAAWLDATYAGESTHYNASQMTAQQLMGQALTTNGVGIGWDIDWRISDWLVPAGAWSLQGGPIDGVLNVAEAVSAIVQADPVSKILHVLPRYAAMPWEWASMTPDIEIPPDIILSDAIEPVIRPDYNAIYISGQSQGAWARVSRAGTAKDKLAPMVTHPLLTAEQALRQRGMAEIGNTGRQARVSISLPISADTTLLQVGQLAAMSESADPWRGLIRSVSVSARWQDGAGLTVNQSAELERHYA